MALEVSTPDSKGELSMSTVKSVVLKQQHVPLLFASCLPAIGLCIVLRLSWLNRVTRGATRHPLFAPLYFLTVGCGFWIGAAANGKADSESQQSLAMDGWLLPIQDPRDLIRSDASWNYWTLFNFVNVRWDALEAASQNIALTVFVGVINLPIYIPALAQAVDVAQYNMNYELFGHGVANVFAGMAGTIPNLVVRADPTKPN